MQRQFLCLLKLDFSPRAKFRKDAKQPLNVAQNLPLNVSFPERSRKNHNERQKRQANR
jgi:hypothetical protein